MKLIRHHPRRHHYFGLRPWKRHSLVLMVLGILYMLIGITYAFTEPVPSAPTALALAITIMPLPGWGLVFGGVGLLAIVSSRWPPASETWGYVALSSLSALWGTFYMWGVVVYGAPTASLTGFFLWEGMAFLWWAISGLVNPTERSPMDAPGWVVEKYGEDP